MSSVENLEITNNFSSSLNQDNIDYILLQYEIHPSVIAVKFQLSLLRMLVKIKAVLLLKI